MGVLTVDDDLPHDPRRILVAGVSGVGKTTFAARVAATLGVPHTEMDGLFHGPGWTERPEFLDEVDALILRDRWITEWQYRSARQRLLDRADTMIWLDLPFRVTFGRVLCRTLKRRRDREVLWNGNVEPPLHTFFTSREHILRWAVSTRHTYRELVPPLATSHPDLTVVRLRSAAEVERWIGRLG